MPRASEPLDDATTLDASRIDVAARIGWLLRVSRAAEGLSLRQMAVTMGEHGIVVSAASLSRIESEGQRSVPAMAGYERVLGLQEGSLRVAVDYLCRGFSYAPPATFPPPEPSLERFSRACRKVEESPDARDWLEFSRYHAADLAFGLPDHLMGECVRRLALELCRSVGLARYLRYEAMLTLRRSPYGDVVAQVVDRVVRDPDLQVVEDLVNSVAELPTPAAVTWCAGLLQDASVYLVQVASWAVQGMLVTGGLALDGWRGVPPALDAAWSAAEGDVTRREIYSELWSALPPELQQQVTAVRPPAPPAGSGPRVWTRNRQNAHYEFALRLAHTVTSDAGLPDDPMLARLLFEAMFEPRGVRMATSTRLLASSPFAATLRRLLITERAHAPAASAAPAVARVAAFFHDSGDLPEVESLLTSPDPAEFRHGLAMVGRSDQPLPSEALRRGLDGDVLTLRSTLTALGLTGDPRLAEVAADSTRPQAVRGAASWWLRQGPRITV